MKETKRKDLNVVNVLPYKIKNHSTYIKHTFKCTENFKDDNVRNDNQNLKK